MGSTLALLIGLLSAALPVGAAEAEDDWTRIANVILHRSLQLAPGERVIIHYLPGREPLLVQALRDEIVKSGAIISAEWTWPTEQLAPYFDTLSMEQKSHLAESQDKVYSEVFARSDIYIWLDESAADDLVSRQFEHLIFGSKVRAIHCHFQGAPDPQRNPELWQKYLQAIEMDPAQLGSIEDSLARQLRGSTAHLTSANGTELTFQVPADAHFHENNGDASAGKTRNPLSTRDREEEIPSGDIRTTGVNATSGRLVGTVNLSSDTAILTFKDGRVFKVEPHGKDAEEFAKWFTTATGDRDRVGELVIGNNPYLAPVAAANPLADFGYSAGTVRLDIGENWESGGSLRTGDHQQWTILVAGATLRVGRKLLIERGKPVP